MYYISWDCLFKCVGIIMFFGLLFRPHKCCIYLYIFSEMKICTIQKERGEASFSYWQHLLPFPSSAVTDRLLGLFLQNPICQ